MIRYTIEGLRSVPPEVIEAANMSGASGFLLCWKVRIPIAVPTMMVGTNQTVVISFFKVMIAAFIGTQDLGQEMQRSSSSTDVGKGLVLGLCVPFIGLTVDQLITQWTFDRKKALGID